MKQHFQKVQDHPSRTDQNLQQIRGRKTRHKTFQRNEAAIHKALDSYISERLLGVQVRDLCRDTGLSSPTFYAHSANINSAYRNYENGLVEEFLALLPKHSTRVLVFTILFNFIHQHRGYFRAVLHNADFCILNRMLGQVRYSLVGTHISEQSFIIYCNEIASVIMIWMIVDGLKKTKVDFYLQKALLIRVRWW